MLKAIGGSPSNGFLEGKMRTYLKLGLVVAMVLLSTCLPVTATILTVTGEFDPIVCMSDKGKMYTIKSEKVVSVSVDETGKERRWILMARADIQNPFAKSLEFTLRRTSEGFGPGVIEGGFSPTRIKTVDTKVFSGRGSIYDINLQFEMPAISICFPEGPLKMKLVLKVVTIQ